MKIVIFLTNLALGGTEKAAVRWAWGMKSRGHDVRLLTLVDGPRRTELEAHGVPVRVIAVGARLIADALRELAPDVIHAHAPGLPHSGDILGEALALISKKIPVVQTNVFGRLENRREDAWTDFRLFISWTSCVQAARRSFRPLDEAFFRRASVAVYPLDPIEAPPAAAIRAFRTRLGVSDREVLFGRFSRPEPNKWTDLAPDAFRIASRKVGGIKLLLREPPPRVAETLRASPDASSFLILPATGDAADLQLTMAALDAVLHTSSMGESFGYGLAEPMNLGKPVITHSVPWGDQAQIELVREGETGFVASTPSSMAHAIGVMAEDKARRETMGARAREHIRRLANPEVSLDRLEKILQATIAGQENPLIREDLEQARRAAEHLDAHQFGHSLLELLALCPFYYRVRFHLWRKARRERQRR